MLLLLFLLLQQHLRPTTNGKTCHGLSAFYNNTNRRHWRRWLWLWRWRLVKFSFCFCFYNSLAAVCRFYSLHSSRKPNHSTIQHSSVWSIAICQAEKPLWASSVASICCVVVLCTILKLTDCSFWWHSRYVYRFCRL